MAKTLQVIENVDKETFNSIIYPKRQPVIMRGVDLGPCLGTWTRDYLARQGGDKSVRVHVSPTPHMDFINKNFVYRTLPFKELVNRASREKQTDYFFSEDELYYLRAVGDNPRKDVADIARDFPLLAADVRIPPFYDPAHFYSSVLRVGSPGLQLWTHYDVMDNMLLQVTGRKRVSLFSPTDALYLYLNGDKSEVLDIDSPDLSRFPEFSKATRYDGYLEPGDVLFLPALWFHNVVSLDFSVAVNVFWRHLAAEAYDSRDLYGNKDVLAAQRAMQAGDRALRELDTLPETYRDFYARRLVANIQSKAFSPGTNSLVEET